MKADTHKIAKQQRTWGWFWYAQIPVVVLSYAVALVADSLGLWQDIMLIYLAVVSVWALGISHHTRAEAARIEDESSHPPGDATDS